ncbi:MAG: hypothetical protein DMG07_22130, partial [Acidobacteria bacterium]
MFGYRAGDVIGRPLADVIIPPDLREQHRRGLARYLATGEAPVLGKRIELTGLRADGSPVPLELSITRMPGGGAPRFTGFLRDISERKRLEAARAHLAGIVESSDDAIISKTLDGIVTTWNAGAERLFGYSAAEMIGRPVSILIPPETPDEQPQILASIKRGERVDHYETVRVRKDRRRIDVSLTVSPLRDEFGDIIGASKIARDITARKRAQRELRNSEAQLRLIWENALDGMRLVDEDGIIVMVNEAYCRLVEKPRAALEGKPLSVLYSAHRQEEVIRKHR